MKNVSCLWNLLVFLVLFGFALGCSSSGSGDSNKGEDPANDGESITDSNSPDAKDDSDPSTDKDPEKDGEKDPVTDEDPAETKGIIVKNSAARGCDILLDAKGSVIDSVSFGDSVKGEWGKRGDRFAFSFISSKDEAFSEIGNLIISSNNGTIIILRSKCYDKSGKALEKPEVVIDGIE